MTYTAVLYIAFEQRNGNLEFHLIRKIPIEADALNKAKLQATRLVKNDARFSPWHAQNPTSRWSSIIEKNGMRFTRKTFRSVPPEETLARCHFAFVSLLIDT